MSHRNRFRSSSIFNKKPASSKEAQAPKPAPGVLPGRLGIGQVFQTADKVYVGWSDGSVRELSSRSIVELSRMDMECSILIERYTRLRNVTQSMIRTKQQYQEAKDKVLKAVPDPVPVQEVPAPGVKITMGEVQTSDKPFPPEQPAKTAAEVVEDIKRGAEAVRAMDSGTPAKPKRSHHKKVEKTEVVEEPK